MPGGDISAGFLPGVAGSYKCYVLFGFILLLLLKMYVTGNISCGKASSLSRSGKGAKRLLVSALVSIAGPALGVEAVLRGGCPAPPYSFWEMEAARTFITQTINFH